MMVAKWVLSMVAWTVVMKAVWSVEMSADKTAGHLDLMSVEKTAAM